MADSIPYGAAANLLTSLATLAVSEILEIYDVENDLKRLKDTLSSVKAVLLDAEEQKENKEKSHAVKNWIRRLNEVVYDADDLFDEILYEDLRRQVEATEGRKFVPQVRRKVRKIFCSLNQIASPVKLHSRIKGIREKLDEIANDISKFNFRERVIEEPKIDISWRETSSFVVESETIGRDKDRENIVHLLLHDANVLVTAIVGLGGLGKTTLAQLVYNDVRVRRYFDKMMWVYVSDDFNVQLLVKKILESLISRKEVLHLNLEKLHRSLREQLLGKRYLLVLDDVWNENHQKWVELRKYLPVDAPGSKILVTTRSKKVARAMDVESPYILEGLTDDQSWTLFKNFAFTKGGDAASPRQIEIGEKIAKKCKGVPLALKSLGSMLRLRGESEWSSVLKSELWELVDGENDIFSVLRLSYNHLPTHLRQCFSYCAMFPKDYEFEKETLIYLWMAQGYIESKCKDEDLEEIGDRYFNELLVRSFFLEFKDNKGGLFYKMHDLIHHLATLIAGESCFVAGVPVSKITRHVYLTPHDTILEPSEGVRTLFVGKESSLSIDAEFLSSHRRLRAFGSLNGAVSWKTLSDSIRNLKHLRFLDISKNEGWVTLPHSITKLLYLETLVVDQILRRLPRDVEKLKKLKYFIIKGLYRGGATPIGLEKITGLHKLSYFQPAEDGSVTLNELNDLNKLRGNMVIYNLQVAYRADLKDILKKKEYLTALTLNWWPDSKEIDNNDELVLDRLEPHPNLQELYVEGYRGRRFSSWISSIQRNLVRIQILDCKNLRHLQPLEHLPSLQTLHLNHLPALEFISDQNVSSSPSSTTTTTTTTRSIFFPSLKEIHFKYCSNLKGWWKREDDAVVVEMPLFPCLSTLFISRCPKLTWMPLFPSLDNHLSLTDRSGKPLLHTLATTLATSASTPLLSSSSSSSIHTPLSKLKTLTLVRVDGVESLSVKWLKNLTSLQRLNFSLLSGLRFLSQGLQHLTSLEELEIAYCHELELSNDEDENDNGTMHWQGLNSLRSLAISGISNLVSLPEGLQCATSLNKLVLEDCVKLTGLPGWIRNLTSLQQLTMAYCPEVTSLEAIRPPFTTLQALSFKHCPHLSRRYGSNKAHDWSVIAHIPNISIDSQMIQQAGKYLLE